MRFLFRIFARILATQKRQRNSQLELLTPPARSVLFLGDSITEQGVWDEWFPLHRVANRGVAGERTDELLARLDTSCNDPSLVLLLIGTNDLSFGVGEAQVASNVEAIVSRISTHFPTAEIVVQSVMPRTKKYRDRLLSLNSRYREIAQNHSATFLDLWPALATQEGTLRSEYTLDHLHLTGPGYDAWVRALRPYVEQVGSRR